MDVKPLAIVTGASRGIGRAIAVRFARSRYTVACIARSRTDLDALAAEHASIVPVVLDLTDESATTEAIAALLAERGPCAVLINNAGYGLRAAIEELPLAAFRKQMEVNLFSCVHLIQQVLPGMRAARSGLIINMSSVSGLVATPFHGGYSATKFALEAISDVLRVELAEFGIRVVLIEPGPVKTAFADAVSGVSADIVDNSDSPYARAYKRALAFMHRSHTNTIWTAESTADVVMRAVRSDDPAPRYPAYNRTLKALVALRKLSARLVDRVLIKNLT